MAKLAKSIVIVGAKRTAFGAMQGSLKGVSATDLAVHAAKAALAQSNIALDAIGHVIIGNVMQTSPDAIYCARHIGLKAGLPRFRQHHQWLRKVQSNWHRSRYGFRVAVPLADPPSVGGR